MRKDKQFLIARFTAAEKTTIREIAGELHIGQSELIRDALIHYISSYRGPEGAPHQPKEHLAA